MPAWVGPSGCTIENGECMKFQYGALRVRAKAGEVIEYHTDPDRPGKPLHMLLPGAVVALASLTLMIWGGVPYLVSGELSARRGPWVRRAAGGSVRRRRIPVQLRV